MIRPLRDGPFFPKSGQKRPGSIHPGSAEMAQKAIYNVVPTDSRLYKRSEKLACPPGIPASAVVFHYVYLQKARQVSMGFAVKNGKPDSRGDKYPSKRDNCSSWRRIQSDRTGRIKGLISTILVVDVLTLKISSYSRSSLIFRCFQRFIFHHKIVVRWALYFHINTIIPPKISTTAMMIRGVSGSLRKRKDNSTVNTILPLSMTLTSDTRPNCSAR